jgi:hypothetical protein
MEDEGMTEMRNLVLGLILLSGVVTGLMQFAGAMFLEYGISNPNNLTSFDVAQNITIITKNSSETLLAEGIEDPDILTVLWSFGANSIEALKVMIGSAALYQNLIDESIRILGLPAWSSTIIYGAIVIFITFTLVSAFMKWRV